MPTIFLVVSLIGLAYTINAFKPARAEVLSVFTFVSGWLTSELPIHNLVWQGLATVVFVALGALRSWPGWVGLAVTAVSWAGLVQLARMGVESGAVVDRALAEQAGIETPAGIPTPRQWKRLAQPFALKDPAVKVIKDIPYVEGGGPRQRLDLHVPRRARPGAAPVLFYVHGGGWVIGNKKDQGLPMINHLAAAGWVCVSPNYRLSPKVTFPEHLIDCKRALRWVKEHIAEYGGDPDCVVVSGGSAGGHLSSLLALTAGRADLQPGFENADLSVRAAVPIYGVYDFTNRDGLRGKHFGRMLAKTVMGATPEARPDLYTLASPMDQIRADAPPFLIVHGSNDTLVPVGEARSFARLLRERSTAPVVYAELPGAQHAFDVFRSLRSAEVVPRIEVFLRSVLDLGDPADVARSAPRASQ
ncbi:MAG: alpha/beta hydrolase [Acidimicrobiales bacterium]